MQVYQDQDPKILLAIAAQSLAGNMPSIGTLNLSPDLLSSLLGSLLAGPSAGTPEIGGATSGRGTARTGGTPRAGGASRAGGSAEPTR